MHTNKKSLGKSIAQSSVNTPIPITKGKETKQISVFVRGAESLYARKKLTLFIARKLAKAWITRSSTDLKLGFTAWLGAKKFMTETGASATFVTTH